MSTVRDMDPVIELLIEVGTEDEKEHFISMISSLTRRGFIMYEDEAVIANRLSARVKQEGITIKKHRY